MNFSNNILTFASMNKASREKIGSILQSARVQRGLSVEEVAERINSKPATLLKIESGIFSLNVDILISLIRALDVEMSIDRQNI